MAVTINGVAMVWGLPSDLAITETVVGSMQLQQFDLAKNAEVSEVLDNDGDIVTEGYYKFTEEATFEYIVKGTGIANAKLQAKIPTPGTIVTTTVTATELGESINSRKWTVQPSPKLTQSNTNWTRVTLTLKYSAGITAAAGA